MTVPQTLVLLTGQARFMQRNGFALTAVASDGPYARVFAEQEGVAFRAVRMSRQISPLSDLRAVWALIGVIRALRPAIVHAHTPKGGLLGMLAAWCSGVPIRIYHVRGLPLETATGVTKLLLALSERVSCGLAHRVFCVSHSLQLQIVAMGLVDPTKVTVAHAGSGNGVDATGAFDPGALPSETRRITRSAWQIPESAVVVACVGRIGREKGIVELASAWAEVRQLHPTAHLVLAGPIDDVRETLPSYVLAGLRSDPSVHFLGLLSDVRAVYAASDLVVHPSHREGFPNVPLEAAAMGRPVVTTQATGCRDAVIDGVTGALVPVGDAQALAAAIGGYLASAQLRERHGRAGRDRALRDFSQERIWSAYLDEYRKLLSARGMDLPAAVTQPLLRP